MRHRHSPTLLAALTALFLAGCSAPSATSTSTAKSSTSAQASDDAMTQTVGYATKGSAAKDKPKIAYIAECASAFAYCQARLKGARKAASHFGADLQLFDANFDSAAQLRQVQDAIQQGYDGYVFSPVTDASGCSDWKLLKATGKPVATINSPMCGNPDYTTGTVGFVGMQTTDYFKQTFRNAFKTCDGSCTVVAVGGYLGSDLYGRWKKALDAVKAEFPEVTIADAQPASFNPSQALSVVQDALRATPSVNMILSANDDMTFGAEQAVKEAGLTPGDKVKIYSVGGSAKAVKRVASGTWNGTSALLPYDESYYGVTQLMRKLDTGKDTPGFAYLAKAPAIVDGPGTVFITSDKVSRFTPQW
ncbi:sugar ABC transporter substrate-binding protein [Streptomyces prunicolor]|uniref:sugar ABC transporter substrate-binding protein n=1 Tax=Streptomyces prunicolor TaxID=67348 RepID=UPI000376FB19|nr:sugar ABC transporter substrate-binding protein [Streptomyces prunicolor]